MSKSSLHFRKSLAHSPTTPTRTSKNDNLSSAFEHLVTHNPDRMKEILKSFKPNSRKRDRRTFETDSLSSTMRGHRLTGPQNPDVTGTSPRLPRDYNNTGSSFELQNTEGKIVLPQLQYAHFDIQESRAQHGIPNQRANPELSIETNPSGTSRKQVDHALIPSIAIGPRTIDDDTPQPEKDIYASACREWAVWILGPRRRIDSEPSASNTISTRTKIWYLQHIFKNRMLVATQEKLQLIAEIPPHLSKWFAESLSGTALVFANYMSKDVTEGYTVGLMDGAIDRIASEYAQGLAGIYAKALWMSRAIEEVDVDDLCSHHVESVRPVEHPWGITEYELKSELEGWDFDHGVRGPPKDITLQDEGPDARTFRQAENVEEVESDPVAKRRKLNREEVQHPQSMNARGGAAKRVALSTHDLESSFIIFNSQIGHDKFASNEIVRNVGDVQKNSILHPQETEAGISADGKRETNTWNPIEPDQVDAIAAVLENEADFHTWPNPTPECNSSPSKHLFADLNLSEQTGTHLPPIETWEQAFESAYMLALTTGRDREDEISFVPTSPEIPVQNIKPEPAVKSDTKAEIDDKSYRLKFGFHNKPFEPLTPKKKSTKELFALIKERELAKGLGSVGKSGSPTPSSDLTIGQMQIPEGSEPLSVKKSPKITVEMLTPHSKQQIPEKSSKVRKSRPLKSTFDATHKAPEPKAPNAMAYKNVIPAAVHSHQVSPVNLTSQSNPTHGFTHGSAISPENRSFPSPFISPSGANFQNFGPPPHYYGPPMTGAGLMGPPAHFQVTDQSRNYPRNHTSPPQGNFNQTVIGPQGIARSYLNTFQLSINVPMDNMSATSQRYFNTNSPESFSSYNQTMQSPTPAPNHSHVNSRRPSYPHCPQPPTPEWLTAIPFYTPRPARKRAHRERVTVKFPSVGLCNQGRDIFHEAMRTNPAFRGFATEADWNNTASELRVTAPAGSNLRGLLMELFPHLRLSASME